MLVFCPTTVVTLPLLPLPLALALASLPLAPGCLQTIVAGQVITQPTSHLGHSCSHLGHFWQNWLRNQRLELGCKGSFMGQVATERDRVFEFDHHLDYATEHTLARVLKYKRLRFVICVTSTYFIAFHRVCWLCLFSVCL